MFNQPIELIKSNVSIFDIVGKYGFKTNYKDFICCPFHNEKTPSLRLFADNNTFNCFGCGMHGDVIDFVQSIEECTQVEAIKKILDMFGLNTDGVQNYEPKKIIQKISKPKEIKLTDGQINAVKNYVKSGIANIGETDYFQKRGLTDETIKRFKLGYDEKMKSVIIPYNRALTYYQTRTVEGKKFFKPKNEVAGSEPLFNEIALSCKPPIFVVESPVCAMSITQCGGNAIAICGCGCWNKIIKYKERNGNLAPLIICLDNDNAGEEATRKLTVKLTELKSWFLVANIADECKDPNELLIKDSSRLKRNIVRILNDFKNINKTT